MLITGGTSSLDLTLEPATELVNPPNFLIFFGFLFDFYESLEFIGIWFGSLGFS